MRVGTPWERPNTPTVNLPPGAYPAAGPWLQLMAESDSADGRRLGLLQTHQHLLSLRPRFGAISLPYGGPEPEMSRLDKNV